MPALEMWRFADADRESARPYPSPSPSYFSTASTSSSTSASTSASAASRARTALLMSHNVPKRRWFQPGQGIAREVITADIQRYLGPDALVKPGEDAGVDGYWVTAYRALTTEMVQDLILDSERWRAEVQRNRVPYDQSAIHMRRQEFGPSPGGPLYQQHSQYEQQQQQQQQQQQHQQQQQQPPIIPPSGGYGEAPDYRHSGPSYDGPTHLSHGSSTSASSGAGSTRHGSTATGSSGPPPSYVLDAGNHPAVMAGYGHANPPQHGHPIDPRYGGYAPDLRSPGDGDAFFQPPQAHPQHSHRQAGYPQPGHAQPGHLQQPHPQAGYPQPSHAQQVHPDHRQPQQSRPTNASRDVAHPPNPNAPPAHYDSRGQLHHQTVNQPNQPRRRDR